MLAIGSDLDGVQTQNFAQPQPATLIAIALEPPDELPRRRRARRRRGRGRRGARRARARRATGSTRRTRSPRVRAEACARARRRPRCASWTRSASPSPPTASLVVDMCIPGYWLAGFYTPAAPRRLQVPLGWGTLGYAFPAALGAALAGTGPVVSISGDGGFLFACGELATMAQEQIPLTAVIVDDGGYGMLRYDQAQGGRRDLRRRPPHARLRGAGRRLRRARRDRRRPRRRVRRGARPPRRRPARRPCSSPAPRPRSSRRPTPRPNWYRRQPERGLSPVQASASRQPEVQGRRAARRRPSGPSGACPRSPSSSTASG